ncbi:hypothetical protein AAHC03_025519 [Spirometra sp. Aus1]
MCEDARFGLSSTSEEVLGDPTLRCKSLRAHTDEKLQANKGPQSLTTATTFEVADCTALTTTSSDPMLDSALQTKSTPRRCGIPAFCQGDRPAHAKCSTRGS